MKQEIIDQIKELLSNKEFLKSIKQEEEQLYISLKLITEFSPDVAEEIQKKPKQTLDKFRELLKEDYLIDGRIRLTDIPKTFQMLIRENRSKHIGKLVAFEGVIRQAGKVLTRIVERKLECSSCGSVCNVVELGEELKSIRCPVCSKSCKILGIETTDNQTLVLEECTEQLDAVKQPDRIHVVIEDGLVAPKLESRSTPGTRVLAVGILKDIELKKNSTKSTRVLDVINLIPLEEEMDVSITPEVEEQIIEKSKDPKLFNHFIDSFASSIIGHEDIKRAILLQLVGGSRTKKSDGSWTREFLHLLLIGSRSTGKSVLLNAAHRLLPRSRKANGAGTTGAGITAGVVKDENTGQFMIEAGAIPLAHNSLLCLDECFPNGTQVLTEKGFVNFENLKEGIRVAQYHEDGKIDFVLPERIINRKFEGNLLSVKGAFGEHISTENHNRVVRTPKGKIKKLKVIDSLCTANKVIIQGEYSGKGVNISNAELKFITSFVADGCIKNNKYGYISVKKEIKKIRLEGICKEANIKYSLNSDGEYHNFYFGDVITKYFKEVDGKYQKQYPSEWFLDLNLEQRRLLIHELLYWDGYRVSDTAWQYFTSDKERLESIYSIAVTSGFSCKVYARKKEGYADNYALIFTERNYKTQQKIIKKEVPYNGNVYCVTVPTGMIVIRQNNYTQITGNCDKTGPNVREHLHECMESGTITISKVGNQQILNAHTSILAAANPKTSEFNINDDIVRQINMPVSLLSRFDGIFVVKDTPNESKDELIADKILSEHGGDIEKSELSQEFMRQYIVYARKLNPIINKEAQEMIKKFYLDLRKACKGKNIIQIATRQLEGIVRLAQANAKYRLSKIACKQDAEVAIEVMKSWLKQMGLDKETGMFNVNTLTEPPKSKKEKFSYILRIFDREKQNKMYCHEIEKQVDEKIMPKEDVWATLKSMKLHGYFFEPSRGLFQLVA